MIAIANHEVVVHISFSGQILLNHPVYLVEQRRSGEAAPALSLPPTDASVSPTPLSVGWSLLWLGCCCYINKGADKKKDNGISQSSPSPSFFHCHFAQPFPRMNTAKGGEGKRVGGSEGDLANGMDFKCESR